MRVYELAKQLRVESKELIDRLKEIGIEVRTHVSHLSSEDVRKAKELLGLKEQEAVVEKRVRSTIIRRRAKRAVVEASPAEESEAPKGEAKEVAEEIPTEAKPVLKKEKTALSPQVLESTEERKPQEESALRKRGGEVPEGEPKPEPSLKIKPIIPSLPKADISKFFEEEEKKREKRKKIGDRSEEDRKLRRRVVSRRRQDIFGDLSSSEVLVEPLRKKRRVVQRPPKKTDITTPKASKRVVKISDTIVVSELARRMGVKGSALIQKLIQMGSRVTLNQSIDVDTATVVAHEFGYEVQNVAFSEEGFLPTAPQADSAELRSRPPVVTVMGHVDHGKTSLLDAIRSANVMEKEAGGITQHIGAYSVKTPRGEVTFIDTPGHEAFTAMRARGAQVTDIVVLVVAADDGVMPQTREAIDHARAAQVPMVVAINKIDKATADPERVKRELAEIGLVPEEWGGDVIFVPVSAKQREGIDQLLEMLLLQAEILELKANPSQMAMGTVIEAKLEKGRGIVTTVVVQQGTLRTGDTIVCGVCSGRVRALQNDRGERIQEAGPSSAVEVLGLDSLPSVGETLAVVEGEKRAREIVGHRMEQRRAAGGEVRGAKTTLEDLYQRLQEGVAKELKIVLKADVVGSVEAIQQVLQRLSTDSVRIEVIRMGAGNITENDVLLASASDAVVIGFNVGCEGKAKRVAKDEGVEIKFYDVIYELTDDVRKAMEGLLEPIQKEVVVGHAQVREVFKVSKAGTIAGSFVTDGKMARNARIRVQRQGKSVFDGKIGSLKRFKDDVREVPSGFLCGIGIESFDDIQIGDVLEAYTIEEISAKLTSQKGEAAEQEASP